MMTTNQTAADIVRDALMDTEGVRFGSWTTEGPDSSDNHCQILTVGSRRFAIGDEFEDAGEDVGFELVGYTWSTYEADEEAPGGWELINTEGGPDANEARAALAQFIAAATAEVRSNFTTRVSTGQLDPDGARMMWGRPYIGVTPPPVQGRAVAGGDCEPS